MEQSGTVSTRRFLPTSFQEKLNAVEISGEIKCATFQKRASTPKHARFSSIYAAFTHKWAVLLFFFFPALQQTKQNSKYVARGGTLQCPNQCKRAEQRYAQKKDRKPGVLHKGGTWSGSFPPAGACLSLGYSKVHQITPGGNLDHFHQLQAKTGCCSENSGLP